MVVTIDKVMIEKTVVMTAYAVIEALKKHKMLESNKITAFERTKYDLYLFQEALKMLSDDEIPQQVKKDLAIYAFNVQRAIKRLKDTIPEQRFFLFYKHIIEGQPIRTLAAEYGVAELTVIRARNLACTQLSALLHPDMFIDELLYS